MILKIIRIQSPCHGQRPSTIRFSRVEICEFKFGCCIFSGHKTWETSGPSHRSLEKEVSLWQHWKSCLGQGLEDSDLSPWHMLPIAGLGSLLQRLLLKQTNFDNFLDSLSFLTALPTVALPWLASACFDNIHREPAGKSLLAAISTFQSYAASGCMTLTSLHSLTQLCSPQAGCGAGNATSHPATKGKEEKGKAQHQIKGLFTPTTKLKNSHLIQIAGSEHLSSAGKPNCSAGSECPAECPKGGHRSLPGYRARTDPLRLFWGYRRAGPPKEMMWQAGLAEGEQGGKKQISVSQLVKAGVLLSLLTVPAFTEAEEMLIVNK